jgi:hypothetical protein
VVHGAATAAGGVLAEAHCAGEGEGLGGGEVGGES